MTQLRPYQVEALAARRGPSSLIVAPTGSGKTQMFAAAAAEEQGRVLIVAHRRELIRQAHRRVAGSSIYPSAFATRIQVGSVQTLIRRRLPQFDLLILDEAHHAVSASYRRLIASQPGARLLGVTACPELLSGAGLGEIFQQMIVGPSVTALVADGYLSPCVVYAPAAPPDVRALHSLAGDFSPRDVAELMDRPTITGDAIEHYGWHTPGKPAIVFCASVAHAEHTAAAFHIAGWRAAAVSGDTPEAIRDATLAGLETGAVEVVCNCSLIDEGLDIPAVSAVIDLAPTKSLNKFLQRVGRGMRVAPGKRCMVLLDHAGNTLRHGMPDAHREWSLAGRPKGAPVPATRQCGGCFAIHAPAPCCPMCGYDYAAATARAERREAERVAGELALLSPEDRRLRRLRDTPLADLVREAQTFDALQVIADARGYRNGWAFRQMGFKRGSVHLPADGTEFVAA